MIAGEGMALEAKLKFRLIWIALILKVILKFQTMMMNKNNKVKMEMWMNMNLIVVLMRLEIMLFIVRMIDQWTDLDNENSSEIEGSDMDTYKYATGLKFSLRLARYFSMLEQWEMH